MPHFHCALIIEVRLLGMVRFNSLTSKLKQHAEYFVVESNTTKSNTTLYSTVGLSTVHHRKIMSLGFSKGLK